MGQFRQERALRADQLVQLIPGSRRPVQSLSPARSRPYRSNGPPCISLWPTRCQLGRWRACSFWPRPESASGTSLGHWKWMTIAFTAPTGRARERRTGDVITRTPANGEHHRRLEQALRQGSPVRHQQEHSDHPRTTNASTKSAIRGATNEPVHAVAAEGRLAPGRLRRCRSLRSRLSTVIAHPKCPDGPCPWVEQALGGVHAASRFHWGCHVFSHPGRTRNHARRKRESPEIPAGGRSRGARPGLVRCATDTQSRLPPLAPHKSASRLDPHHQTYVRSELMHESASREGRPDRGRCGRGRQ